MTCSGWDTLASNADVDLVSEIACATQKNQGAEFSVSFFSGAKKRG
jgi:hypothetical protein